MSKRTKIAWCDSTFNPWIGCTKLSPACDHCYAERYGWRFGVKWGAGKPRRRTSVEYWRKPELWNKRLLCERCAGDRLSLDADGIQYWCADCGDYVKGRKRTVFCGSLCDWLDPEVPIEWLADLLDLIRRTPNLTWLLLTKRPKLWEPRIREVRNWALQPKGEFSNNGIAGGYAAFWLNGNPPTNVRIGWTTEDQERFNQRTRHGLRIPAVGSFVSCEPMLGPIEMKGYWGMKPDWVILGGESGPHARPCNIEWIRDGVSQCREAGVAAFVKQLGAHVIDENCVSATAFPAERCWPSGVQYDESDRRIILRDPKGGDPSEWPEDLRVREVSE